jgi:hypothetical protein
MSGYNADAIGQEIDLKRTDGFIEKPFQMESLRIIAEQIAHRYETTST